MSMRTNEINLRVRVQAAETLGCRQQKRMQAQALDRLIATLEIATQTLNDERPLMSIHPEHFSRRERLSLAHVSYALASAPRKRVSDAA